MKPQNEALPDYIILKAQPGMAEIVNMEGEWLDIRQMPMLEAAVSLHGLTMTPTDELEYSDERKAVAQVWMLAKQ